jgi:hypothetical protein
MTDPIARIRLRLEERGIRLHPPAASAEVAAFEAKHDIVLPEDYRRFITEIGDGGPGPVDYGILPLGHVPSDMTKDERSTWTELRDVTKPFPFTRAWVWESDPTSDQGDRDQVDCGSLCLGTDGCGMYWHLIVNGSERGVPWMFAGEGITPVSPKRSFLRWYEDWLDGKASFYGYHGR